MGRASPHDELLAIADLIDRFIDGDVGPYEWDDYCSLRGRTPDLEILRYEIARIADDYPHSAHWCSDDGVVCLRAIAQRIRTEAA